MKFKRNITEVIEKHFDNYQIPIMIIGARQVGKTTTILNYLEGKNFVEINFEQNPSYSELFSEDYDIKRIVTEIQLLKRIDSFEILFLDEIQACPSAITALKYFAEKSNIKVICSGSGLGIAINKNGFSFPVGKVKIVEMFPMTFFEYLYAQKEQNLVTYIKENKTVSNVIHKKLLDYFDTYMMIGGLPACIAEYLDSGSLNKVFEVNKNLLLSYKNDINKYADPINTIRIRNIYDNVNGMLLSDNQKFKFSKIDKQGYKTLFTAFEWLNNSYLTYPVYMINNTKVNIPLSAHIKENQFKLIKNDTSLILNDFDYQYNNLLKGDNRIYRGTILENYVGTVLRQKFQHLYYYHQKSTEVDYLVQYKNKIIPIEIKSGKNNPSKSLIHFMETQGIDKAIKITRSNYYIHENVENIPIYAIDNLFND